jgi:hypothetical protein
MSVRDIITSVPGLFIILLFRMFLASLFICGGINLFDFKKQAPFRAPFFTFKRVVGLFLLIFGSRLLINSVLFSAIS